MKHLKLGIILGLSLVTVGCAATPSQAPVEAPTKTLAKPETIVKEVVETAVVEAEVEEVFTQEETEKYQAEQKAAQEAQAERKEEVAAAAAKNEIKTIATGTLQSASGKKAAGSIKVEEKGDQVMITLSSDFSISDGPDLYVALSQEQPFSGGKNVALEASKVKIVDALANQKGEQVYTISKAEYEKYNYGVTIWCQKYNILFGATPLEKKK